MDWRPDIWLPVGVSATAVVIAAGSWLRPRQAREPWEFERMSDVHYRLRNRTGRTALDVTLDFGDTTAVQANSGPWAKVENERSVDFVVRQHWSSGFPKVLVTWHHPVSRRKHHRELSIPAGP